MPADNQNPGAAGGEMPPDAEKPKAQEGAPRDVAEIELALAAAAMADQPIDELAKELALALIARGAQPPPGSVHPPPTEVPTMGMKPEDAYARARDATKEGIEAVLDGRPDLSEPQRAQVRKAGSVALARELASTYTRPSTTPEKPTMGLPGHPSTQAGGGKQLSAMARACTLPADPMVRAAMGYVDTSEESGGLEDNVPGHLVVVSLHRRAAEAKARSNTKNARGAS